MRIEKWTYLLPKSEWEELKKNGKTSIEESKNYITERNIDVLEEWGEEYGVERVYIHMDEWIEDGRGVKVRTEFEFEPVFLTSEDIILVMFEMCHKNLQRRILNKQIKEEK